MAIWTPYNDPENCHAFYAQDEHGKWFEDDGKRVVFTQSESVRLRDGADPLEILATRPAVEQLADEGNKASREIRKRSK